MQPSYGLSEETYFPQIRTEMENGSVISRRKFTRARDKWNLEWDDMPEADYQTLKTFFEANQGLTFYWTHPLTNVTYTARFSTDRLANNAVAPGHRRVSCPIEEV